LECTICVEQRTANARQVYYNKPGDWRPRLIIWPEYNRLYKKDLEKQRGSRLDEAVDTAWSDIIAETVRDFSRKLDLSKVVFRRLRHADLSLGDRLARAVQKVPVEWVEESTGPHRLTPDYALARERGDRKDEVVYLLSEQAANSLDLRAIVDTRVMDRATLLPYGRAILEVGAEEPVAEISFAEDRLEALFVEVLAAAATRYNHRLEPVARHFLTWWVVANRYLGRVPDDDF